MIEPRKSPTCIGPGTRLMVRIGAIIGGLIVCLLGLWIGWGRGATRPARGLSLLLCGRRGSDRHRRSTGDAPELGGTGLRGDLAGDLDLGLCGVRFCVLAAGAAFGGSGGSGRLCLPDPALRAAGTGAAAGGDRLRSAEYPVPGGTGRLDPAAVLLGPGESRRARSAGDASGRRAGTGRLALLRPRSPAGPALRPTRRSPRPMCRT